MTIEHLNLADLKAKTPAELLAMAEEWEIENAPSMRKGEMMFSILKEHAEEGWEIGGVSGVPAELWHEDTPRVIQLLALYHYRSGFGVGCDSVIRCDFVIITEWVIR